MDCEEKLAKHHKEIGQAKEEYKELQEFYKNKKFSNIVTDDDRFLFNKDDKLFDGYYKSLTFTVYNADEMCELSKRVDIYNENEILIIEGFDITK